MASDGYRFTWMLRWALLLALMFPLDARAAEPEAAEDSPAPEDVQLRTKDGLHLHAVYYAGTQKKNSVPIILLHAYNGDCHDFDNLALMLQHRGHAVITPDLRGHGESKEINRDGRTEKIETKALRAPDFVDMWKFDLEAVKSFLIAQNNLGELNIDKLCVVGTEMGALIAADWAQLDWSWPVLSNGKQGQDVKALVLISPEPNFKGMKLMDAISVPEIRSELAIMLIAGRKNSRASEDANKLYKHFAKFHVDKTSPTLELLRPETKLQGAELLNEKSLGVEAAIVKFVDLLVKKPFPWDERRSVLE